jgi:hypothetical protein
LNVGKLLHLLISYSLIIIIIIIILIIITGIVVPVLNLLSTTP